jgi:hypothetical protein
LKGDIVAATQDSKLKVFVSYSRSDTEFVDELVGGLDLMGYETSIDRQSIAEGEDWRFRLGSLIADADTVVFVLSPSSAVSEICRWEVEEARARSKRIVPVLWRPLGDTPAPPSLAALNYVRFDEGYSFVAGLRSLIRALNTNVDWLREHTRLLARAMEWETAGRQPNRMLLGNDIATAKDWAANRPKDAPEPTELHMNFIKASEEAELERTNTEYRRISEIKAAQDSRAEALAGREEAVRKLSRRTTIGLTTAAGLTVTACGLAYWGVDAERRFRREQQRAENAALNAREEQISLEASRTDIVGQFAAYGASPGQFGDEGPKGQNSPYTARMLEALSDRSKSLQAACFAANETVLRTSRTKQRPFLSTDMNGQLYLQRNPASRKRAAIVVSNDKLVEKGQLYNTANDARAWSAFLQDACGFAVVRLHNPDREALRSALARIDFAAAEKRGEANPLVRKTGLTLVPGAENDASVELAPPNTLLMFFFAGFGLYASGSNYLMTVDADARRLDTLVQQMMPLTEVQDLLRRKAAASILVLDTNFPVLEVLQQQTR